MANPYAMDQLGRAFLTATTHEDAETRDRADRRAARWMQVIQGMASGNVAVGSRTPVRGLPSWVTLEVVRGGFATGAAAGGPLEPDEVALAHHLGRPLARGALFSYYLTDRGLAELVELLESRRYRVERPEEAVLLTLAWLVRAGDRTAALDLLDAVQPFIDRLRFTPRVAEAPALLENAVFRRSAGQTVEALNARQHNGAVEAQREALAVWNPLADRFLQLWWRTRSPQGQVAAAVPTGWADEADMLLAEYERQALVHPRCRKHRNPKDNLAILVAATQSWLAGGLEPRLLGRLRRAVSDMVAKRGEPGSHQLAQVRQVQGRVAALPAHRDLARLAAARLGAAVPDVGVSDPETLTEPVTDSESAAWDLDAGYPLPAAVRRVVRRSWAAPVEVLLAARVVPSAEVLAELIPQLTAVTVAASATDPELSGLVAANYQAFRRRRSLLLLNLQQQVQIGELPWVQAVQRYVGVGAGEDGVTTGLRVAGLTIDTFPGTLLPNPLIRELKQLFASAERGLPLVEELAADIFMGEFSQNFTTAAQTAARLLRGSLYARYYDLSYDKVLQLPAARPGRRRWKRSAPDGFAELCAQETGYGSSDGSVAANGQMIERSQLYTTHNLAVLVDAGLRPPRDWLDLAQAAFEVVGQLLARAVRQPRPLATIKDAAYAWRHALFFLAMAPTEVGRFLDFAEHEVSRYPAVESQLRSVLAGLSQISAGGTFTSDGIAPGGGRRLLGWTTTRHWILGPIHPAQGSDQNTPQLE